MYQVSLRARLLHQKSHLHQADYVIQVSKYINLQIVKIEKVFWGHSIVLWKELLKIRLF